MDIAFQPHWLETVTAGNRAPREIAQAIGVHPEFQKLVAESVNSARQATSSDVPQARFIAEGIVCRLHQPMGGFTTMH